MKQVVELARRLGVAIAAHEHCAAVKSARDALKEDKDALSLEEQHADIAKLLDQKAATGQPLEPDEKRKEQDLRSQLAARQSVRDFARAQADFHALMQAVNEAIEAEIGL